jgi:hypothetical protein
MSVLPPPDMLPTWDLWSLLHLPAVLAAGIIPPVLYLRFRSGRPLPGRIVVMLIGLGLLFLVLGWIDVIRRDRRLAEDPLSQPESMWIAVRFLGFMELVSSTIATHVMWVYLRTKDRAIVSEANSRPAEIPPADQDGASHTPQGEPGA